MTFKIILPLFVVLHRKTKPDKIWPLNLNRYRNENPFTLNAAKIAYKEIVRNACNDATETDYMNILPSTLFPPPYIFTYTVFPANKRSFDIGNVLPVIQKFCDDALIELGVIPDDNYKIIARNIHCMGSQDKENPRVELCIEPEKKRLSVNLRALNRDYGD